MKVILGDITKVKADIIVNAANGHIGCMGAGIAKAIKDRGGQSIETHAKALCKLNKYNPGQVYVTNAGKLDCQYVIHAVTMAYPGERSHIKVIKNCLNDVFAQASALECKSIALPSLGTGIGRVPVSLVADLYKDAIPQFENNYGINAIVVDLNKKFIELLLN